MPAPVLADDTDRRRRAGRLVVGGLALLTAGYLAVVGLAFAGAPLVGHLAPPGIARHAGDPGTAVGSGAREDPLAPAAGGTDAGAATGATAGDRHAPSADGAPPATVAPGAAAATSTTTTTAPPPRQGTSTTLPTPSSTVPDRAGQGGGPPDHPPGKP